MLQQQKYNLFSDKKILNLIFDFYDNTFERKKIENKIIQEKSTIIETKDVKGILEDLKFIKNDNELYKEVSNMIQPVSEI